MQSEIIVQQAKYAVGSCVRHRLSGFRGLVLDVDPRFQAPEEAPMQEAVKAQKLDSQPWYHVLVHDTSNLVYTAEQSLMEDESAEEVENPAVEMLFTRTKKGQYQRRLALQ